MESFHNVLVGVDLNGSNSPALLTRACQITDPDNIEAVHVCDDIQRHRETYAVGAFADSEAVNRAVRGEADAHLASICRDFGITRHRILDGDTALAMHDYARSHSDLVVVGTHGRQGLRTWLGSTSNAVVQGTPCDVLAVQITEDASASATPYQRILVAVDLSDESCEIMDHALRMAEPAGSGAGAGAGAGVAVCHVYSDTDEDNRRRERQLLAQLGSLYGLDDRALYSLSGNAAHSVHALALALEADLTVVGTHGTPNADLLKSSMANSVLHGASYDALSVRIQ